MFMALRIHSLFLLTHDTTRWDSPAQTGIRALGFSGNPSNSDQPAWMLAPFVWDTS
jgi:hypothetical protein